MNELSRQHGVTVSLIHRVIMRESKYSPGVTNGGHYGMMQIKLATAKSMGYQGGVNGLLDGHTNMTYAVPYLANAYIVADRNEDRAVQLYAGGYYYVAKRKGVLGKMRTAHSASVNAFVEQARPSSSGLFGSLFSAQGGGVQPAAAYADTPRVQIAQASEAATTAPAEAAAPEKKLSARERRAAKREQARLEAQNRKEEAARKATEEKAARAEKAAAAAAPATPESAAAGTAQPAAAEPEKKLSARERRAAKREQARLEAQNRKEEAARKATEEKAARAEKAAAAKSATSKAPVETAPADGAAAPSTPAEPAKSQSDAPASDTPAVGKAPASKTNRRDKAAKPEQATGGGRNESDEAIKKYLAPRPQ